MIMGDRSIPILLKFAKKNSINLCYMQCILSYLDFKIILSAMFFISSNNETTHILIYSQFN